MVFNTGPYTVLPDNSILITPNMQSETGFPSSHQLKSYVASKSRLKLAACAVLSADASATSVSLLATSKPLKGKVCVIEMRHYFDAFVLDLSRLSSGWRNQHFKSPEICRGVPGQSSAIERRKIWHAGR